MLRIELDPVGSFDRVPLAAMVRVFEPTVSVSMSLRHQSFDFVSGTWEAGGE